MSCRQERQLGAGAWNEVAREGWTGVKHPPGKQARWMGGGSARGKGRGRGRGWGSLVPSRAWDVGQEHSGFLGDIHLHPSVHLLSASRCQDNLPAQPRRQQRQGGGRRRL